MEKADKYLTQKHHNADNLARNNALVLWFDELRRQDVDLVGGKSSSLGELTSQTHVPVPYGYATTSETYRYFMRETGCNEKVDELLKGLKDVENSDELHAVCSKIRKVIVEAPMPETLAYIIGKSCDDVAAMSNQNEPYVAVRSSATAEDLPNASFAGEQDTYLNVHGRDNVIKKVQECYASLFTDRVVNELANGIRKVVSAMAPRPVILRFSDFKSGEYRNLKGGEKYEPTEPADLLSVQKLQLR